MGRHRRLFSTTDLSKPITETPRHRAEHEHRFETVAEFSGRRSSIAMCACGESRTEFAMEAAS